MENLNVEGSAADALVRMDDAPAKEQNTEEQQRLHAYLIHLEDGKRAVDIANAKVAQAEVDLEGAHEAVRVAEAELAQLEGRE